MTLDDGEARVAEAMAEVAKLGMARAPGESDEQLRDRIRLRMARGPVTGDDVADMALAATRWARQARVTTLPSYRLLVEVRGPLGLPMPGGALARVRAALRESVPVTMQVYVRRWMWR